MKMKTSMIIPILSLFFLSSNRVLGQLPCFLNCTIAVQNICCCGEAAGQFAVTTSGGVPPYDVSWAGPVRGSPVGSELNVSGGTYTVIGLLAGSYTVTVTDVNGCACNSNITILEPPCLQGSAVTTCAGIEVTALGGIAPYDVAFGPNGSPAGYEIFTSGGTYLLTNLTAGVYSITITDSNGALFNLMIIYLPPPTLQLSQTNVDVLCAGQSTGSIDLTLVGGTPFAGGGYTYNWTGPGGYNSTVQDPQNLFTGNYSVMVTDSINCTASLVSIDITAPPILILTSLVSNNSIDISVSGVTPGYTYSWIGPGGFNSSVEDLSGLSAGTYIVLATDANNCIVTDTFVVNNASIDVTDLSKFSLFPNPTFSVVNVIGLKDIETEFEIFDGQGRVLKKGNVSSANSSIDLNSFAAGIYLIKIKEVGIYEIMKE